MQNQSEQIHGLVGEPIPEWSRIYKGPYYLGKIEAGWTISEESERIAEEAYTSVEKGKEMPPRKKVLPVPIQEPVPEPVVAVKPEPKAVVAVKPEPKAVVAPKPEPKAVVAPKPEPKAVVAVKPEPKAVVAVKPEPVPEPAAKPKKRTPQKKKTDMEPTAFIDPAPQPEVEVITVKVKPTEIDGRKVYLSNLKDKVYDMKYNYLGRYNRKADKIETTYADSDAE